MLVLEDDEGLADLYTVWLSEAYDVRTAYTAAEAYEKFDEDVDVALLDRRLPEESGDEVLDWIAQDYPQCRRVMVTAVNPDVDIVDMPFDDYFLKPIDKDSLLDAVQRLEKQRDYEERVQDLYALVRKRSILQSELSEVERSESEEYARLESEISDLKAALAETNEGFDYEDFRGILRCLGNRQRGD
ncbi:HalX domain-containing protein [Halobacterium jilantaiense]|uniref:HalX domain-containing protein n=1 Tax=Halobacterium jilantaiense TaxID=355548 RepID=UPI001FE0EED8|nr:HalX domain-containing protein [Halobacterium jilantaiense]